MTRVGRGFAAVLTGLLAGCGGGGGPTDPPSTPPVAGHPVTAVVYYDENANGAMDAGDRAVPDVEVVIDGKAGRSAVGTGAVTVANVSSGSHQATLRAE